MTVRLYLKKEATKQSIYAVRPSFEITCEGGEKSYINSPHGGFETLKEFDPSFTEAHVAYLTIKENFWEDYGQVFFPGKYEGQGFCVDISNQVNSIRGSDRQGIQDKEQKIRGRFDTLPIAIAFWEHLCDGTLLPTKPLCRVLNLTEQAYASQASSVVNLSAQVGELAALVAQLQNHVTSQSQLIQDHILTPRKQ